MRTSQVIKSIKCEPESWTNIAETTSALIFTNHQGWYFVRQASDIGGGFKLVNRAEEIEMNWIEQDTIANQLWDSLASKFLGF